MLALLTALLAGCASTADPPHYPEATWTGSGAGPLRIVRPVGAPACHPTTAPDSAAAYDRWMAGISGLDDWRAADVGLSTALVDGRTLWLFGDTTRAAGAGPRFASSSILVTEGDCTAQAIGADDAAVLPNSPGSVCWPSSLAARSTAGGDDLWIGCSRVQRTGKGLYDFAYLGASLVTVHVPRGGVPGAPRAVSITPDRRDPEQVNWATAMVVADGWLYVYGTVGPGSGVGGGAAGRALMLARAPLATAVRPTTWTYWTGSDWSPSAAAAAAILPANPGVSQALSVHRINGSYVAVGKQGGDLGNTLAVWRAPAPQGPWTVVHRRSLPHLEGDGVVTYQPLAHPELPLADGKLLVSYSRNPTDQSRLLTDPSLGRPRFLEVPRP